MYTRWPSFWRIWKIFADAYAFDSAGTSVLGDGRVMITGGRNAKTTTFYIPGSDQWIRGDDMNIARGYQTSTVLGNGDVFVLGGSWSGGVGGKVRKGIFCD